MTSLFERGLTRVRDILPDAAGVTVEVRAGNEVIEQLSAAPGRRDFQQYAVDEFAGTAEVFDWIVAEQDLVFAGTKKEPAEGWEIRLRLNDGRTAVYLAAPTGNKRVFDVLDNLGLMYRIHSNLDRIEAAK